MIHIILGFYSAGVLFAFCVPLLKAIDTRWQERDRKKRLARLSLLSPIWPIWILIGAAKGLRVWIRLMIKGE